MFNYQIDIEIIKHSGIIFLDGKCITTPDYVKTMRTNGDERNEFRIRASLNDAREGRGRPGEMCKIGSTRRFSKGFKANLWTLFPYGNLIKSNSLYIDDFRLGDEAVSPRKVIEDWQRRFRIFLQNAAEEMRKLDYNIEECYSFTLSFRNDITNYGDMQVDEKYRESIENIKTNIENNFGEEQKRATGSEMVETMLNLFQAATRLNYTKIDENDINQFIEINTDNIPNVWEEAELDTEIAKEWIPKLKKNE